MNDFIPTAIVTFDQAESRWLVSVSWSHPTLKLGRPVVGSWSFPDSERDRALALRFAACVTSGKAYKSATLKTDVTGQTYVEAKTAHFFHGKHFKASLSACGF